MEDDLLIDKNGSPGATGDDGRKNLTQGPGAWKLLSTSSELLLALRDRADGLIGNLNQLHPSGTVLAGDLAEMQPCDLLNFLHQGRRTGVLLTRSDGVERGIVLLEGNVAWACSTSSGEMLGELLCRMGLADRAQVQQALRRQSEQIEKRRLGELLLDIGALDAKVLLRGLRHQAVEIFLGLLVTRSGSFVFLRGVDRTLLPAMLELDTQGLLLDGLRRLDEMELYRTRIANGRVQPAPTGKPLGEGDGSVTPEARLLLPLCDGTRTLEELAMLSALGEFEATKAVYKLLLAGHVAV